MRPVTLAYTRWSVLPLTYGSEWETSQHWIQYKESLNWAISHTYTDIWGWQVSGQVSNTGQHLPLGLLDISPTLLSDAACTRVWLPDIGVDPRYCSSFLWFKPSKNFYSFRFSHYYHPPSPGIMQPLGLCPHVSSHRPNIDRHYTPVFTPQFLLSGSHSCVVSNGNLNCKN